MLLNEVFLLFWAIVSAVALAIVMGATILAVVLLVMAVILK